MRFTIAPVGLCIIIYIYFASGAGKSAAFLEYVETNGGKTQEAEAEDGAVNRDGEV